MPSELLTASELLEQVEQLVELHEQSGERFPHVVLQGSVYSHAEPLRTFVRLATAHQLADVRRQLATAEGELLEQGRRRAAEAERSELEDVKHGPMTDAEERQRQDMLARAQAVAEHEGSVEGRLERVESVLTEIRDLLKTR